MSNKKLNSSISIITVTHNAAKTLKNCLDSITIQTPEVEYIIVDGVSDDETIKIIDANCEQIAHFISEPDKGIYDAMNKGIAMATGDIVGILNADDFYASPYVLLEVVGRFKDPEIDACYGDLAYVDSNYPDRVVRYWQAGYFYPRQFYYGWMPPHPTFFVRRKFYEKYGTFNLALGSAADYELMLRFLLKYRIKTVYIPKVLVKMRTGGVSNASLKNRLCANQMDRMAWKVNGLKPYPWTLTMKPVRKISQYVFKKIKF